MAYAFQEKQDDVLGSQKDEEQQNNTMLTSTAGDLGAETFNAGASGQSVGQKDQARQPQQTKRELLSRNQGRAQNPFQFQQTRQALGQAKQGVQTERDTYMQNAVAPYQYGQAQQQAVKTYAREGGPAGQTPDWLAKYQQGVPTALPTFQSNVQTNFAPVNALKTDAGVRSFLRNPNDPESRSGEQAIDFSLLNADPTFNINREGVLRDYSDLLNRARRARQMLCPLGHQRHDGAQIGAELGDLGLRSHDFEQRGRVLQRRVIDRHGRVRMCQRVERF